MEKLTRTNPKLIGFPDIDLTFLIMGGDNYNTMWFAPLNGDMVYDDSKLSPDHHSPDKGLDRIEELMNEYDPLATW